MENKKVIENDLKINEKLVECIWVSFMSNVLKIHNQTINFYIFFSVLFFFN